MAPAHATVVSILAKFRIPGTSSLTTCAFAAAAIRLATVNSASVGIAGCMPAPPLGGGAYHCCRCGVGSNLDPPPVQRARQVLSPDFSGDRVAGRSAGAGRLL